MSWKSLFKLNKMKARIAYWVSVVLLMVFIVCPMFFFFYLFDEDQVKQMLYDQFDRNSYHVDVRGKITPKLWHGLSFEVNDLHISNNKDIELLRVKEATCQLSWLDLVVAHYKIRRMALNDVDVYENNVINSGLSNLLNFSSTDKSSFNRLKSLSVFNINSIDKDAPYPIRGGLVKIDQFGSEAIFKLGFELSDSGIFFMSDGKISSINTDDANSTSMGTTPPGGNILKFSDFTASIYNTNMRVNLTADANYYVVDKRLLLKNISGDIALNNSLGRLSAKDAVLLFNGAELNSLKVDMNLNNVLARQKLSAEFDKVIAPWHKELIIANLDLNYLMSIGKNKFSVISKLNQVKIDHKNISSKTCSNLLNYSSSDTNHHGGFNASLYGDCAYDFDADLLNLNMSGEFNKAPLKLSITVNNNLSKPKLTVLGVVDNLDVSALGVNQGKLMPFYYDAGALPFEWLSSIDMEGELTAKHFSLDRINLDNVSTSFELSESTLNVNKLEASVYGGVLTSAVRIAKLSKGYDISTIGSIHDLNLKEMFKDLFDVGAISGSADLMINASIPNASSYEDLHKYLTGKVLVNANHGAFEGVDFNLFSVPKLGETKKSTIFERLSAKFDFVDGISKNGVVTFSSPYVIADGSGTVDFANTLLDYVLTIKSALPPNDQQIRSVVIPVMAKGDLFNPQISIQNIHLFTGAQSSVLREQEKSKDTATAKSVAKKTKSENKLKHNKELGILAKIRNKFYKQESVVFGSSNRKQGSK
ncbi:MAG: AsmA protein [Pseudomonadota bacterium]|nr:AsmA protein [Pseudomonadota bacterium]